MAKRLTLSLIGLSLVAACGETEPPARTVTEFLENPILLEAAVVRCNKDRTGMKYDQECINAREAVKRIQAKEEEARRRELEARSEAKRRALRRTQEAQAEARRRAADAQRRREEAEYLAQFGALPPNDDEQKDTLPEGNLPIAVLPDAESANSPGQAYRDTLPATDGGNAPTVRTEPSQPAAQPAQPVPAESQPTGVTTDPEPVTDDEQGTDLDAVREELRRRAEVDDD